MLYSGRDHQYIEKTAFTSSVQRLLRISKLGAYSPSLFLYAYSNLWAFHTHWPLVWAFNYLGDCIILQLFVNNGETHTRL